MSRSSPSTERSSGIRTRFPTSSRPQIEVVHRSLWNLAATAILPGGRPVNPQIVFFGGLRSGFASGRIGESHRPYPPRCVRSRVPPNEYMSHSLGSFRLAGSMSPREANRLLREAIIQAYFAPQPNQLAYNPT